jgi:ketosteroid isomerase-like protein
MDKSRSFAILLITITLVIFGSTISAQMIGSDEDINMIKTVWDNYASYVENGDGIAWLSQYDAEGIQLRPDAQARSKEELDAQVPAAFKERVNVNYIMMTIIPLEIVVADDWAYSRGRYTQIFKARDSGKSSLVDGKFLTIFKKQADGTWKIYRDCFNSNVSPK